MEREQFKSRIGFILISAGCAIGMGNIWRFPYVTGNNGGAIFVLFYLLFLLMLAIPVMIMELAVGRASRASIAKSFHILEKPGTKWHWHGKLAMVANYVLMMFYTVITGWMLYYFIEMVKGTFVHASSEEVTARFGNMVSNPVLMVAFTAIVVVAGFLICSAGLQKGIERITKVMMLALLALLVVLAVNSFFLEGGSEGFRFYLVPDWSAVKDAGLGNVIVQAMNQAFFTLSIGIGSMAIFGSYVDKSESLLKEALTIAGLDTFVALMAGVIIFPACFAYHVNPDSGPQLVFVTLPNVFATMQGGRFWGSLFFLFMVFAAFSTVIAVFENIMSMCMEVTGWSREKTALFNTVLMMVLTLPCILGFNVWSGFEPLGEGTNILDLEDFFVSNLVLPVGSLVYTLFCMTRYGWGSKKFYEEVNEGRGMKLPKFLCGYLTYVLPAIILVVLIYGIVKIFC